MSMLSSAAFMNDELGDKTRTLLRDFITSFEMLEIFLLLHANAGHVWSVAEVAERVRIADDLVARALESLTARDLILGSPPLAPGRFQYAPRNRDLADAADELARDHTERRAAVLSTMSTNAIERLRSGALNAFADAFVFGGKRKDG
jgi:hypothetical protein